MMRSQSASFASKKALPTFIPAKLTRGSARPVCRTVLASRCSIEARSVTSTGKSRRLTALRAPADAF